MKQERLNEILREHELWLEGDKRGQRANLSSEDLRYLTLENANLSKAYLRGAKMEGVNAQNANFSEADMAYADMENSDFARTNLEGCDLRGANLKYTCLWDANMRDVIARGADFKDSNMSGADLTGAIMSHANLVDAVLKDANLTDVELWDSNITGANLKNADMTNVELDYSCLPLWCGSLEAHFDDRQIKQIAYHLVKAGLHSKNTSKRTKAILDDLVDFANECHRAEECGMIERW